MKTMYALYDDKDNFINCGFTLAEAGATILSFDTYNKRIKRFKLYKIPLLPQDDIFNEEDKKFLEEFENQIFENKELAEKYGCSVRTIYRRKRRNKNER